MLPKLKRAVAESPTASAIEKALVQAYLFASPDICITDVANVPQRLIEAVKDLLHESKGSSKRNSADVTLRLERMVTAKFLIKVFTSPCIRIDPASEGASSVRPSMLLLTPVELELAKLEKAKKTQEQTAQALIAANLLVQRNQIERDLLEILNSSDILRLDNSSPAGTALEILDSTNAFDQVKPHYDLAATHLVHLGCRKAHTIANHFLIKIGGHWVIV